VSAEPAGWAAISSTSVRPKRAASAIMVAWPESRNSPHHSLVWPSIQFAVLEWMRPPMADDS
jgi:hypothetical protein